MSLRNIARFMQGKTDLARVPSLKTQKPGTTAFCNHLSLAFPERVTTKTAACTAERTGLFLCSARAFQT